MFSTQVGNAAIGRYRRQTGDVAVARRLRRHRVVYYWPNEAASGGGFPTLERGLSLGRVDSGAFLGPSGRSPFLIWTRRRPVGGVFPQKQGLPRRGRVRVHRPVRRARVAASRKKPRGFSTLEARISVASIRAPSLDRVSTRPRNRDTKIARVDSYTKSC